MFLSPFHRRLAESGLFPLYIRGNCGSGGLSQGPALRHTAGKRPSQALGLSDSIPRPILHRDCGECLGIKNVIPGADRPGEWWWVLEAEGLQEGHGVCVCVSEWEQAFQAEGMTIET